MEEINLDRWSNVFVCNLSSTVSIKRMHKRLIDPHIKSEALRTHSSNNANII